MKSNWSYLSNPFDNVTKRSFKKMLIIATDHNDKLFSRISDPDINNLYVQYQPLFLAFKDAYDRIGTSASAYRASTIVVENLFTQLMSTKVKQWDIWVQNVFFDDTPEYALLFPERRGAFQSGAYDLRISAIRKLRDGLANYPALSNVYNDVVAFLGQIETARSIQQGKEIDEKAASANIEDARVKLADCMQGIMGFLMYKYQGDVSKVELFYELQYFRSSSNNDSNTMQTHTITSNNRLNLYKGELNDRSNITIENTSNDNVSIFTSGVLNSNVPANALILLPKEIVSFFADEYSDGTGFDTLVIVNSSGSSIVIKVDKEQV
ncbi:MAG: hypothetical protein ACKVTZ_24265 [Bacteroidia bacterium]